MFPSIGFIGGAARQTEEYGHIYSLGKELRRRSMYIQNLTQGLTAPHKHGKKSHQYQKNHSSDILHQ
ncbi:hypothetical protein CHS0354_019017, partial [Potamilus streckersoni]